MQDRRVHDVLVSLQESVWDIKLSIPDLPSMEGSSGAEPSQ